MAITQTDIDNMESMLVVLATQGYVEYEFDGARVRYTSLDQLQRAISQAKSVLALSQAGNCFKARLNEASD